MSPYPAQVSREAIVERAREIIENEGLERLTLQHLAAALGIQAPSPYHHVANKRELLRAVNERSAQALVDAVLAAAEATDEPVARLLRMAKAYRAFAHEHPITYELTFSNVEPNARPDPAQLEAMALPAQALVADLTGEAASLSALRGLLALMHGFVLLELNQQLRRGGDLGAVFEDVVQAYLRGWRGMPPEW